MTPKQIRYSKHATQMMKDRGITRWEVRWLIASGVKGKDGRKLHTRRGYIRGKEAMLLYLEGRSGIFVITVEWIL